ECGGARGGGDKVRRRHDPPACGAVLPAAVHRPDRGVRRAQPRECGNAHAGGAGSGRRAGTGELPRRGCRLGAERGNGKLTWFRRPLGERVGMRGTAQLSSHESPVTSHEIARGIDALTGNLERVVVGKRTELERAVAVLLAGGHLLLQDVPGVGKTVLARAMARSIGGTFKRVQATPDLLPSDITGGMVYDGGRGTLRFVAGPVFANVVLADELNRPTCSTGNRRCGRRAWTAH